MLLESRRCVVDERKRRPEKGPETVFFLALLLDRGANPSLANCEGFTPAHVACVANQLKCLQLLIARRANINAVEDVNGLTPLDYARRAGFSECVELLLENSAIGSRVEDLPPTTEAQKVRLRR